MEQDFFSFWDTDFTLDITMIEKTTEQIFSKLLYFINKTFLVNTLFFFILVIFELLYL